VGAYLALLTALEHPESTSALVYISGNGAPSWWSEHGSAAYRADQAHVL
jgi:pimeloyl-ACP methyl ester carboxylesterase